MSKAGLILEKLEKNQQEAVGEGFAEYFKEVLEPYGLSDVTMDEKVDDAIYADLHFGEGTNVSVGIYKNEKGNLALGIITKDEIFEEELSEDAIDGDDLIAEEMPSKMLTDWAAKHVSEDVIFEAFRIVFRDGKKVKVPIKRKRKRASAKQKAALKKARRKAHSGSASKKRRKSMKLRKRAGQ